MTSSGSASAARSSQCCASASRPTAARASEYADRRRATQGAPEFVEEAELERDDGCVALAQVCPRAGLHDEHLHALLDRQPADLRRGGDGERPLRAGRRPLRVGDDREVLVGTGEPARRAQFGERLAVVTGTVGGQAGGLTDDTDAGRSGPRGQGVLPRGFGVVVEQATHHDEVPGDLLRREAGQARQGTANVAVELRTGDVLGDRRTLRPALLVGPVVVARAAAGAARPAGSAPPGAGTAPVAVAEGAVVPGAGTWGVRASRAAGTSAGAGRAPTCGRRPGAPLSVVRAGPPGGTGARTVRGATLRRRACATSTGRTRPTLTARTGTVTDAAAVTTPGRPRALTRAVAASSGTPP